MAFCACGRKRKVVTHADQYPASDAAYRWTPGVWGVGSVTSVGGEIVSESSCRSSTVATVQPPPPARPRDAIGSHANANATAVCHAPWSAGGIQSYRSAFVAENNTTVQRPILGLLERRVRAPPQAPHASSYTPATVPGTEWRARPRPEFRVPRRTIGRLRAAQCAVSLRIRRHQTPRRRHVSHVMPCYARHREGGEGEAEGMGLGAGRVRFALKTLVCELGRLCPPHPQPLQPDERGLEMRAELTSLLSTRVLNGPVSSLDVFPIPNRVGKV